MPSASLNRMTVPLGLASDQSATDQGLLMPKLKYRFRVFFDGFGSEGVTTELTKQVMDFTRPSVSFAEIPIDIYNSKLYLTGKHEWETVTINLRDDAINSVTRLVSQQLQKQMDFVEQASASSGIDYKFTTRCQVLDGGNGAVAPTVLETWRLYGCYLASANYNELNYATSEPVTIALTIRFDNANLSPNDTDETFSGSLGRTTRNVITGVGN
jgi:hypothetical protein